MKKLYIIKLGSTDADIKARLGDFEDWIRAGLGVAGELIRVIDVRNGQKFANPKDCAGVVLSGSHAMVTDNDKWSARTEKWLKDMLLARVPVLGICYGHQLLARAAGGKAGYHPGGKEIGTVEVRLAAKAAQGDPLFSSAPANFLAHATHSQTVLRLPHDAILLAESDHDPRHAFRIGPCAWGVQFHPEFDEEIMRAYIQKQAGELAEKSRDPDLLLKTIAPTPDAAEILSVFGRLAVG